MRRPLFQTERTVDSGSIAIGFYDVCFRQATLAFWLEADEFVPPERTAIERDGALSSGQPGLLNITDIKAIFREGLIELILAKLKHSSVDGAMKGTNVIGLKRKHR